MSIKNSVIKAVDSFLFRLTAGLAGLVLTTEFVDTTLTTLGGLLILSALFSRDIREAARKPMGRIINNKRKSLTKLEELDEFFAEHGLSFMMYGQRPDQTIEIKEPETDDLVKISGFMVGFYKKL